MSEQQVLNLLADLEEYFYYRQQNPEGLPSDDLMKLHDTLNDALRLWHRLTGCANE